MCGKYKLSGLIGVIRNYEQLMNKKIGVKNKLKRV